RRARSTFQCPWGRVRCISWAPKASRLPFGRIPVGKEPGDIMRWLMIISFGLAASLMFSAPLAARLYSPRVVSPHVADSYSMRTFADFPRWKNLTGDARAWEVFQYLTDERTGLFPLG